MGFFDYWFKKPQPEPEPEPEEQEPAMTPVFVPMSQLLRAVVYDAGFNEPEAVIKALGLQGISAEVEEMEVAASERRLEAIEPLAPFLGVMSGLLARATIAYSVSAIEDELSEEVQDALGQQFQRIALGSSVAALASLIDLGLLKINGAAIGMGPSPADLGPEFFEKWGNS